MTVTHSKCEGTGKLNGAYNTLRFNLSPEARNLLSASRSDFSFKLTVNTPTPGVVLDRFQVSP